MRLAREKRRKLPSTGEVHCWIEPVNRPSPRGDRRRCTVMSELTCRQLDGRTTNAALKQAGKLVEIEAAASSEDRRRARHRTVAVLPIA